jgi:hypothetical protein
VPGASYFTVTDEARPGRILLAEQQVLSIGPPIATQLHRRLRVAPEQPRSAAGSRGTVIRVAGLLYRFVRTGNATQDGISPRTIRLVYSARAAPLTGLF